MKRIALFATLSVAVLLCSCTGRKAQDPVAKALEMMSPLDSLELKYESSLKPGDLAPEFSAPDTLGTLISLSDYAGKYLVVDFWASWCRDCRREIPEMKALFEEFGQKTIAGCPVEFLSVSFDHQEETWKACIAAEEFPWPQVSTLVKWKQNPISISYDVNRIPTMYVISPDGKIAAHALSAARLKEILTLSTAE